MNYSAFKSDFNGGGAYGCNSTTLGVSTLYFEVTMSGASASTKPLYFQSTRGVRALVFTGDRLYLSSKYPGGKPVNGGAAQRNDPYGNVSANKRANWTYTSYDNQVTYATIVIEATWGDPSSQCTGLWHFFAKSIKLKKNSSGGYDFQGTSLPSAATGSGYVPA